MPDTQIIEYKGKKIIFTDFNKDRKRVKEIVEEAKAIIKEQPLNSAYILTDVTGLIFNSEMVEIFKQYTEHNKIYVKSSAVVGIIGLQKIAYDAVMRFSNRNVPNFSSKQEALDWLAEQE